ncbi:MAG TPA: archaetidylserine decarboxylase [Arenimonas sp.]|nr:archaetidylserine decarboxylase [Arenimonas sp.]
MKIAIIAQYLLPHRFLSRLAYYLAHSKTPWIKRNFINTILANFDVNMSEALDSNPDNYESFNAFFTRALKPGARVADANPQALLLPADGKVSQCGVIKEGRIFQAKGHEFTVAELLGDTELAKAYQDGEFMNIYLSPRDYHRVHMPWSGILTETLHVPGRLFSVSPATVNEVPRLFARNERLVCHFDTDFGPMCMVMVGAMLVSGVETVWNGVNIPKYANQPKRLDFRGQNITVARFTEMARFNYGSTVIVLFPAGKVKLDAFAHQAPTQLGKRMGMVIS